MQALNYISSSHKLNYLSPLIGDVDSHHQFRINDTIETDHSSSSSPRQDFDWYSRRSSPMMKSDRCSEDEGDDEADEVLSVGCESPPPLALAAATTITTSTENLKKTLADGHQSLKFSIDNILRPEFGERIRKPTKLKSKRVTDDSPVDLSKECSDSKSAKTESDSGSSGEGNTMWPAWVYCTRYSDRPSSGKYLHKLKNLKCARVTYLYTYCILDSCT